MNENLKLCATCKWRRRSMMARIICFLFGEDFSKCGAPQNMVLSLVDGRKTPRWTFCSIHRRGKACNIGYCGEEGRFYEPKKVMK